ncbi:MAG: tyrosine-type recombinase/integrase [Gammaproteobacteria bacterium]|nr:tyrosine-type recombinase/integrase [Gammaproteobacteria bacterium]
MDKLLPKPARVKKVAHHPAMPHHESCQFISELKDNNSNSALALQFLMLTATRTSEVLQAQWHEIDTANNTWTIPAERMKTKREHRVPLSRQAMEIINKLPSVAGNPYLFTGARRGHSLSNTR